MKMSANLISPDDQMCHECKVQLVTCESKEHITPWGDSEPYDYMMEYSVCPQCKQEWVLSDSILINSKRAKQARLEMSVAWRMKAWVSKN